MISISPTFICSELADKEIRFTSCVLHAINTAAAIINIVNFLIAGILCLSEAGGTNPLPANRINADYFS
jgi:hypothetical protein